MNRVIAFFKRIRFGQILTTFFAGIILFFTQACNSVQAAAPTEQAQKTEQAPNQVPDQTVGGRQKAAPNSEVYVPKGDNILSPNEGGMNNYSDTDPRSQGGATAVKAKSEALKQNAEENVIDETANVGETTRRILDKKGDNFEQIGKNLQRSAGYTTDQAQESAADFGKGTKRGLENIQDNTKDAAKETTRNVKNAAEDTKINAQRTAGKAGNAINDAIDD